MGCGEGKDKVTAGAAGWKSVFRGQVVTVVNYCLNFSATLAPRGNRVGRLVGPRCNAASPMLISHARK